MSDYGTQNNALPNSTTTVTPNSEISQNENQVQIFDLNKTVISHKEANNRYKNEFDKIAKSKTQISKNQIVETYKKLYYDITINGAQSHKSITEQSYNFLNVQRNKLLDSQIERYLERIGNLNKTLYDLQNPNVNQHPIYENGSFLIAGVNGEKYQDMDTVYIMQEGRLRAFNEQGENKIYMSVRRLFGLPEDFSGLIFVTIDQLNEIPQGKDIKSFSDLNLIGEQMYEENPEDILGVAAYYTVTFRCEGQERQDIYDYIADTNADAIAQFFLVDFGCKIHYISDEFTNDGIGPEVKVLSLEKGESQTVKILRDSSISDDAGFGLSNIPPNLQEYYDDFGSPEFGVLLNGSPVEEYTKLWGAGQRYNSVIYAEGRILSQEEKDPDISNEFYQQDDSLRLFNGLGTNFDVVPKPDDYGMEMFGDVRRIYARINATQGAPPTFWGNLNQNAELNENFKDRNYKYYQKQVRRNEGINITNFIKDLLHDSVRWLVPKIVIFQSEAFNVYGQPIIRYDNDYYVVLKGDHFGITIPVPLVPDIFVGTNFYLLYRLRDGEFIVRNRKRLRDASINLNQNRDPESGKYKSIRWDDANIDFVHYIGFQGYQLNGYNGTGNYFNPDIGGSNYRITPTLSQMLVGSTQYDGSDAFTE